ncbi:holo-ACP synthase [Bifidobacterium jacchi]|uniref:4'-phosphopantetheinyl transferase superfamily protein n=1 Tax=Bifidobacterium jacchi TaxID=2490545 RepID=A0A5N5RC63_9BIFI|nr:4'-phosphopantetheinyl transferase superfamily protein [Bifidobacterium jacchi]
MILGIGHDVADIAAFAQQLAQPGTRMRALFSARELRQSALRAELHHDGEQTHLAAKWAGKEALLKAWCAALGERSYPFGIDDFPWASVEILDDARGVPHVVLTGDADRAFRADFGGAGFAAAGAGVAVAGAGVAAPGADIGSAGIGGADIGGAGGAGTGFAGIGGGVAGADVAVAGAGVPASGHAVVGVADSAGADRHVADALVPVIHISLSHDGGIASAVVLIESR